MRFDVEEVQMEREREVVEEGERTEGIFLEEIREAIKTLRNGKSPGTDGLNAELYKTGEGVELWLLELLNEIWDKERIPDEWSRAVICPIYKKGDKRICNNYRGIALLNVASKIYERILERRLRIKVEDKLGSWQYGFRAGKSTMNPIFYMKMMIEKTIEWNKGADVAFVDFEKAFDRIDREKLWRALDEQEYEIPQKLKRAIKSTYCSTRNKIRGEVREEGWFEVSSGGR